MEFPDHNVAPRIQKRLNLSKKRQNSPKSTFCSDDGSDSRYIDNESLYFHWTALSKAFRAQEVVFKSQNHSPTTEAAWLCQKKVKLALKIYFLLWWGTCQLMVLSKEVFRAQEGISSRLPSDSTTRKVAWIGKKNPTKFTFCSNRRTRQLFHR